MKIKFNLWSFILSLICILAFLVSTSSKKVIEFATSSMHIHPLYIVLFMSSVTFFLGLFGFAEATNWKLLLRSILTVLLTFTLSALALFIILVANMFQFT